MGDFFVSHATKDKAHALDVVSWLEQCGETNIFLDSDAQSGIRAGDPWQEYIFDAIRGCRAVVLVWTETASASRWVFAELVLARVLGRPIIPIVFDDTRLPGVVDSLQKIKHRSVEDTLERLARTLRKLRRDPTTQWDRSRKPYPGIAAYAEADEGVFFGRESVTNATIDALMRARDQIPTPMATLVGPSGSGKSSVLHAGVVPALRRDDDRWIVVGPFRPRSNPMDEFTDAVETAFAALPSGPGRDDIRRPRSLDDLSREFRQHSGHSDARVVIAIDQFEELLALRTSESLELCRLLVDCQASGHGPILLASMRSDMLGALQRHPTLGSLHCDLRPVPWMDEQQVASVIEGPAQQANLELEAGLTGQLVSETTTAKALPLLAFTLAKMYENREHAGSLTKDDYSRVGTLKLSVANTAREVAAAHNVDPAAADIRPAMLALAKRGDEGGWTRRSVAWSDVPDAARPFFDGLVASRLLSSQADRNDRVMVEVTHEHLFESWHELNRLLDRYGHDIDARDECQFAAATWEESGRLQDYLWTGHQLSAARALVERGDVVLSDEAAAFVQSSQIAAEQAAEQQRRLAEQAKRDEVRRRRNRFRTLALVAVGLGLLSVVALLNWRTASQRETANAALAVAAESRNLSAQNPALAVALALESTAITSEPSTESLAALHDVTISMVDAMSVSPPLLLHGHSGDVRSVDLSADGSVLVSAGDDGSVRLWNTSTGEEFARQQTSDGLTETRLHPAGDIAYLASRNGSVLVWDGVSSARTVATGPAPVSALDVHWDTSVVAIGRDDGSVEILNDATQRTLVDSGAGVAALRFMPGGRSLAIGRLDGSVSLWSLDAKQLTIVDAPTTQSRAVLAMSFSQDGAVLAVGRGSGALTLYREPFEGDSRELSGSDRAIWGLQVTNDGREVVTAGLDGLVRTIELSTGRTVFSPAGDGTSAYWDVAVSANGTVRATASEDALIRVWNTDQGRSLSSRLLGHHNLVFDIALDVTGQPLTASADGTIRSWVETDAGWKGDVLFASSRSLETLSQSDVSAEVVAGTTRGGLVWIGAEGEIMHSVMPAHLDGTRVGRVEHVPGTTDVISVGSDGFVKLWQHRGETATHQLQQGGPISDLAISAESSQAITAGIDGVEFLSLEDLRQLSRVDTDSPAWAVEVDDRSGMLAIGESSGRITVLDQSHDEVVRIETRSPVHAFGFDPKSSLLLSGHADSSVRVWDLPSGAPVGDPVTVHGDEIWAITFTDDGDYWYTASGDASVRRWARFWDTGTLCDMVTRIVKPADVEALLPNGRRASAC